MKINVNKHVLIGKWKQVKGRLEQLAGFVEERYGVVQGVVERHASGFLKQIKRTMQHKQNSNSRGGMNEWNHH